jgi:hypothetical protein
MDLGLNQNGVVGGGQYCVGQWKGLYVLGSLGGLLVVSVQARKLCFIFHRYFAQFWPLILHTIVCPLIE